MACIPCMKKKHKISRNMRKGKFTKDLNLIGGAVVGSVASDYVDPLLGGNQMLAGGAKVAAGVLLSSSTKSEFIKGVGYGMAAEGGKQLVSSVLPSANMGYNPASRSTAVHSVAARHRYSAPEQTIGQPIVKVA